MNWTWRETCCVLNWAGRFFKLSCELGGKKCHWGRKLNSRASRWKLWLWLRLWPRKQMKMNVLTRSEVIDGVGAAVSEMFRIHFHLIANMLCHCGWDHLDTCSSACTKFNVPKSPYHLPVLQLHRGMWGIAGDLKIQLYSWKKRARMRESSENKEQRSKPVIECR